MSTQRKRKPSSKPVQTAPGGIVINASSILSGAYRGFITLASAVLLYMVTSWISTSKENAKKQADTATAQTTKLDAIQTYALPQMQTSIEGIKSDVKEANSELKSAKAVMITRTELDSKNLALQNSIKEVKDSVHDVTIEQNNVRDALLKAATTKPPK